MHVAGQIVVIAIVVTLSVAKSPYVKSFFRSTNEAIRPLTLKTFSWDSCGSSTDLFQGKNLTLSPDPVVLPGNITISFALEYLADFGSPLQATVIIAKKVGPVYVKLPCIGLLGSCSYDDFCEILGLIPQCPQPLVDRGIACQCPFKKGSFAMPATQFQLYSLPFVAGDYHARINLTTTADSTTRHVGCYETYLTLSEEYSIFGQQYFK